MNDVRYKKEYLSNQSIADALGIWQRATIDISEIRHNLISAKNAMNGYRLPASAFLYISGTSAEVSLDDTTYSVPRFGFFHGAKGRKLSIRPAENWLEYYMVLYKAQAPTQHKREFQNALEHTNPFRQQYGFLPENPIFYAEQLRRMYEAWKQPDPLEKFYEKTAFYQLVYETYKELASGKTQVLEPDLVAMAKRHIKEHCAEGLSVQDLAELLGLSPSYFRKLFKQRVGISPQEYMATCRMKVAHNYLAGTGYSMRSIALSLGFYDEYHFSSTYKKAIGLTPLQHRAILRENRSDFYIGNTMPFPYNKQDAVSFFEPKGKGANFMIKEIKSKAIAAAALSLMLLFASCNTAPANGDVSAALPAAEQSTQAAEPAAEATRIVQTTLGDVEVPANPQRVVVQYLMGDVVTLGIMPVGVSDVYDGAAFADLLTDSVSLGWFPDWEVEGIMALDPDLILVIDQDSVEKFSKVAPTIYVPYGDMKQEERVTFLGEVLNKQEEAAKAIALYDKSLQEAKSKLAQAGFDSYTVSVFEGGDNFTITVRGDTFGTGSILHKELGLKAPAAVQTNVLDAGSGGEEISFEVLADYSGDFIVRNTYEGMADLSQDPIWNLLSAVANNRVIGIEFGLGYYPDILSATAQLNYITEALLQAK